MAAESSPNGSASDAGGRLCRSCGLCCDGSFFGFVELSAGDDAIALANIMPLGRKREKPSFAQPCPALHGTVCSIYGLRPQVCRNYRCRVLRGVQESPARLADAQETATALAASFAALKAGLSQAGFLTAWAGMPAAIKEFRTAFGVALDAGDAKFLTRHRELILRWKKTAWLMQAFDEKAAAQFALPGRQAGPAAPPRPPGAG